MIFEKLQNANSEMELWWDSLPATYPRWMDAFLSNCDKNKRDYFEQRLLKFYNPDALEKSMVKGCTTNTRLVWDEINTNKETWTKNIKNIIKNNPNKTVTDLYWLVYKEIFATNAKTFFPLWEKSQGKYGWISAQLPPVISFNTEKMIEQGIELAKFYPNIMVKVVGSYQGYEVIEHLTSLGISTNNTLAFDMPHFTACINAINTGLEKAKKHNVDLSKWSSVITYMIGRYGAEEEFQWQATERGISLTQQDIRWAEMAIYKKIYNFIQNNKYPSKMLLCSLKIDSFNNTKSCMHLEKSSGSNCIYTLPPTFLAELILVEDELTIESNGINEKIPEEILAKLLRIPYFEQAYDENGILPEEFNIYPAFSTGLREVSMAYRKTLDSIRICM